MQDYVKKLQSFNPILKDDYIELQVPVILSVNSSFIKILIFCQDDHYLIADNNYMFDEFNEDTSFYYNKYKEYCKENDILFELELEEDHLYKIWPDNYNIIYALDGFIRMLINFDDFIAEQNLC